MLADRIGVGILGLGQLGADAAQRLTALGFNVAGWSRSRKTLDKIASYWGGDQLGAFLSRTDILICLLPLTPDTRDILNAELFSGLRPGAFLVNPARGEHLVEDDLLAALDGGRLGGACLDVFRTEPLPPGHPFWTHPKITITPHVASLTNPAAVAPGIYANYQRVLAGQAPLYTIDPTRGY